MERALPLAVGVGLLIGLGVHRLVPSVPLSAGTTAVYFGAAYVWFAFNVSLLAQSPGFDDRIDGLDYGVGLLGVSVTPLCFVHSAGQWRRDGRVLRRGRGPLAQRTGPTPERPGRVTSPTPAQSSRTARSATPTVSVKTSTLRPIPDLTSTSAPARWTAACGSVTVRIVSLVSSTAARSTAA